MEPAAVEQAARVVAAAEGALGPELLGAYLFGSAVLGGLRPRSDVDVLAVSRRATTRDQKRRLVAALLDVSGTPRPVELTLVVEPDVRPWRYPPRRDFQFGEWWRAEFEAGDLEPWAEPTDPDLASLITMVLAADRPLRGPRPIELLDPVPRADQVRAMRDAVDGLLLDLENDTRNGVLTLARIWSSLVTRELRSKDAAADWALERLPPEHRPVLARARAIYLGDEPERWDDLGPAVRAHAEHVAGVIERIDTVA